MTNSGIVYINSDIYVYMYISKFRYLQIKLLYQCQVIFVGLSSDLFSV